MLGTTLILLLALLAAALPVAGALGTLGLLLDKLYSKMPLSLALGEVAWSSSKDFLLVSIPMFILLGEILLRAGVAERMYGAMVKWLSWIPGGLMHSNIGACAIFAATSGSSVATAATVGTVALPLVKKHGYNERLFLGTLAAGGTLGILIPPSINMIIYAVLTDTSIPKLYLAGIIPGLGLAGLFMLLVALACFFRPTWGGSSLSYSWGERIASLVDLVPPLGIFLVVVGSIYAGIATPTEAASLGVVAALGLAAWYRKLSFAMMREVLTRRFARLAKDEAEGRTVDRPGLVIIDGGKGQLDAALAVLNELGLADIPLLSIAKGPDRNAGRERFFVPGREPFMLEAGSPILYFLQRLRDEAHRFAIGTHRAKRSKAMERNPLDEIQGIGPTRKKALLLHFGSARAVERANLDDLEQVAGISKATARQIYDHFHGDG